MTDRDDNHSSADLPATDGAAVRNQAKGGAAREMTRRMLGSMLCVHDLRERLEQLEAAVRVLDGMETRLEVLEAGERVREELRLEQRDERAVVALPNPFYIAPLVTGSDHLHFGYFLKPDDTLREAQDNMMRLNLFFLPGNAQRVLDVGSGLGATSRLLASRGLSVTSLCPDEPLVAYAQDATARESPPGSIDWQLTTFEDFQPQSLYDFVLFQESFQYLADLDVSVPAIARLTRPGGRILISDQFINEDRPRESWRFPYIDRVLEIAEAQGLYVRTTVDITHAIFPTIDRFNEDLRTRRDELIARYADIKPGIAQDIETMLQGGRLELDAIQGGVLSYRIIVLDAPE